MSLVQGEPPGDEQPPPTTAGGGEDEFTPPAGMVVQDHDALVKRLWPYVGPALRPQLRKMGITSLLNLDNALKALCSNGYSGELKILVPANVKAKIEIEFTGRVFI